MNFVFSIFVASTEFDDTNDVKILEKYSVLKLKLKSSFVDLK